jgi:hypothetical protein
LDEYALLESARNEVDQYFSVVAELVTEALAAVHPPDGFKRKQWNSAWWSVASSLVAIDSKSPPARSGQEDIYCGYWDLRSKGWTLDSPGEVLLRVEVPKVVSGILKKIDADILQHAIKASSRETNLGVAVQLNPDSTALFQSTHTLGLASSSSDAQGLASELKAVQASMDGFLEALVRRGPLPAGQ